MSGLAFACAGWAALGLAMDRHYADIYGRGKEPTSRARRHYRAIGALALLTTFAVGVRLEGWTVGSVLCLGTMVSAALLLVLLLSYAPHRLVLFGMASGIFAFLFGVIWLTIA
jgi:hypothetical protein